MRLSDEWFEDEVRSGFYVSSIMKRNWGAQVKLLDLLADFCKENDIKWYIFAGTLLGAVRHKGFIPWDDDIDIIMLREEFERFSVLIKEKPLPEGLFFIDPIEVNNSFITLKAADYTEGSTVGDRLKVPPRFPYGTTVDVFVADYIDPDEKREKYREHLAFMVQWAISIIAGGIEGDLDELLKVIEPEMESLLGNVIDREKPLKDQLFILLEFLRMYTINYEKDEDTEIASFMHYINQNNNKQHLSCYKETVMLEFEGDMYPAPAGFDQCLREAYGDYMIINTNAGRGHEYPLYMANEKNIEETIGENWLYKYTVSEETILGDETSKSVSVSSQINKYIEVLNELLELAEREYKKQDFLNLTKILELSQKTAIDFGELIENNELNQIDDVVHYLEEYCEIIFELYSECTVSEE